MSKSAVLVGVGGQGAILTAKIFVSGLMSAGYDVKTSEVHGMSQRGGSVSTQVHWGTKIYAPVIGEGSADLLIAFEEMEAARYAKFLKPGGIAVINEHQIPPSIISSGAYTYPADCVEAMKRNFQCLTLKASAIASALGNVKCTNLVLFGAMAKALAIDEINWEVIISETVPQKLLDLDLKAYHAGRNAVTQ